jgi:positive regulator of sigma E activity
MTMARLLLADARVVSRDQGMARLRLDSPGAGGGCRAQTACGGGGERVIDVIASAQLCAGDRVSLQMPEAELNRSALLAYLLPAASTLLGALALSGGGDALAVLGAASGLGFGLVCLRISARRNSGYGVRVCQPNHLREKFHECGRNSFCLPGRL